MIKTKNIPIGKVKPNDNNPRYIKTEQFDRLKESIIEVTDPPYGVDYHAEWRAEALKVDNLGKENVKNDDRADWQEAWALAPSRVAYVWHADRHAAKVAQSLEKESFEIRCQIIWKKNALVISRGHYHWQHEPCWYAIKKGNKGNWAGDRKQSTIWEIDRIRKSESGHATQKPVECMARPLRNHDGDVYDPFIGSGSTMVAAEGLSRVCYAMDLNPKCVQMVLDRMEQLDPDIEIEKVEQ